MPLVAAPVFPSLYQEGQAGGGWDVQLSRPGLPLFLQFKLSDLMTRRTCREARSGRLTVPCYRMHLRPSRNSRQHEMLLDLETSGQEVYYSAPGFREPEELNDAFLNRQVRARSLWLRPSDVGPLPDDGEHHVSFILGGPCVRFSEPRPLEVARTFAEVSRHLEAAFRARGPAALGRDQLQGLADTIVAISEKRGEIRPSERRETRTTLADADPLQRASYYALVFLECQLFVLQQRSA